MAPESHRRISEHVFYGCMWAGVAVSICFVFFRLATRWKFFKRLFWDDALVVLALICFLASSIVRSIRPKELYLQFDVVVGTVAPTPAILEAILHGFRVQLAAFLLSFCCIWFIKFSFLVFFRRLGSRLRGQRIWWWCVTTLTLISVVIFFSLVPYRCMTSDMQYTILKCASQRSLRYYNAMFRAQMAVDIVTELLIISIPVNLLWKVQLPLKQKIKLLCLFSLTLVVMVFAIIRVAMFDKESSKVSDTPWLFFWSNMESTVAIIVACLGSFQQLFSKPSTSSNHSSRNNTKISFKDKLSINNLVSLFHRRKPDTTIEADTMSEFIPPIPSQECLHPLKSIYVTSSYEVEIKHEDNDTPSVHNPNERHIGFQSLALDRSRYHYPYG